MAKTVTKTTKTTKKKTKKSGNKGKTTTLMLRDGAVFPKECVTLFTTRVIALWTSGTSAPYFRTLTYKANSFHQIGPQNDWAGSFSTNVPTGLYNLLSSNTASGSVAPYARAYIDRSSIEVQYSTQGTINTSVVLAIIPSLSPTLAAITISNLVEQPFAKYVMLPPVLNTKAITLSHSINMEQITGMSAGVARKVQYEYTDPNLDPVRPVYWHVLGMAVDGATTIYGNLVVSIKHHATLFNNNVLNSGVPA